MKTPSENAVKYTEKPQRKRRGNAEKPQRNHRESTEKIYRNSNAKEVLWKIQRKRLRKA